MMEYSITLPSKPRVVSEEEHAGTYEIDGLYPGYGHTLGNSLRRIILSSLPGAAITSVKIEGAEHEFSTVDGLREDVVTVRPPASSSFMPGVRPESNNLVSYMNGGIERQKVLALPNSDPLCGIDCCADGGCNGRHCGPGSGQVHRCVCVYGSSYILHH